jgi:PAS domain S-box-containing protein
MKNTKVALNGTEREIPAVFENPGDAVLIYINGRFTDCNEAALTLFNFKSKEAALKAPASKTIPKLQPDGASSLKKYEAMSTIALEKGTHRFEWIFTKNEGEDFPVEVSLISIVDESKQNVMYAILRDITGLMLAKMKIRDREKKLQEAQEIALLGHWNLDIINNKFNWSDQVYSIYGVSAKEFYVTHEIFLGFIHRDDRRMVDMAYQNSLKTKTEYNIQYRIKLKDSQVKHIHEKCITTYNINGAPVSSAGTIQDITKQIVTETALKALEKKLKQSEMRYKLAMKGAKDGLWEWNIITDVVYFSPRWKSMLGYEDSEIKNNIATWTHLIHPDDRASCFKTIDEYMGDASDSFEMEFRMKHRDGHYVAIRSRGFGRRSKYGEIETIVGTNTDISQVKEAEERIEALNVELERRVIARTKMLKENQIRLDFLLSSSPVVIYTCKPSGDFGATFMSKNVLDIFGYDPAQFAVNSSFWMERIHEEDYESVLAGMTTLIETETCARDYRFKHNNGSYIWVYDEIKMIYNEDGTPQEIIGYCANIDRRKKAERKLVKHTEELSVFNEIMIDREMRIIDMKKEINALSKEFEKKPRYDETWKSKVKTKKLLS